MRTKIKRCDFCRKDTNETVILRDTTIKKKDGSDIILCSRCLNHYVNGDYDKVELRERLK